MLYISQKIASNSLKIDLYRGIFWKILSCLAFAGINIMVRYLSGGSSLAIKNPMSVLVIMFFQNLIGTILLLPFIVNELKNYSIINNLFKSKYSGLHWIRIITAILGIALWYFSISKMPVPQVVAISFISPILTVMGASIILKEKVPLNRKLAIFLSMAGGFLITRPDLAINQQLLQWIAIFPICAALIFAADKLITRKLFVYKECPKLTTMYLLLFTTPVCLVTALITNSWDINIFIVPITSNFFNLLVLGALSALAHFSFNKSLEISEITLLMPYGIAKIFFCSILSYLVFAEAPQTFSMWLGIIIISLSTILLTSRVNKKISNATF